MKKYPLRVDWDTKQQLNLIRNEINEKKGFIYLKDSGATIRFLIIYLRKNNLTEEDLK